VVTAKNKPTCTPIVPKVTGIVTGEKVTVCCTGK
jgi:hypothetical protein